VRTTLLRSFRTHGKRKCRSEKNFNTEFGNRESVQCRDPVVVGADKWASGKIHLPKFMGNKIHLPESSKGRIVCCTELHVTPSVRSDRVTCTVKIYEINMLKTVY
jgi:hypothetical protein